MWLYVPTSLASAPEPEASTSASDSRAQLLARSVTWNGKHSRWQTWSQRFKRVSWTTHLYGAILSPSTAALGVESWIGSLEESRASHTAPRDKSVEQTTIGTFGPTPPESSEKSDQASSSWRTFQVSHGITTSALGQSFGQWVTELRKDYSRRLKSGLPTRDNGSLSWVTPTARDEKDRGHAQIERVDAGPAALGRQVLVWPTMTASDASSRMIHGRGDLKLDGAARMFPTPTSADGERTSTEYMRGNPTLQGVASPLAQMTSKSGHTCSQKCRRLNPLFVEWLMGWPGGWTLLPTGRIDSLSWETAWSRWWRLMRSALSRLERGL